MFWAVEGVRSIPMLEKITETSSPAAMNQVSGNGPCALHALPPAIALFTSQTTSAASTELGMNSAMTAASSGK